jgi:hypothetical protein
MMRLFVWLAKRWFPHITFSTDPKTGSVVTMVFSTREGTIDRIMNWMVKEQVL